MDGHLQEVFYHAASSSLVPHCTAHAFAHRQFSHVANFWKQGRQASFRLNVLPDGQAALNLTFQLPPASEVVPPPSQVPPVPAPQRPIHPLFPKKSGADLRSNQTSPKVASRRQRKSYRRSVLHQAALAASSTLPPPKNGSLRQVASACAQRLQAALQVNTQTDSTTALSPLAQRIRSDIKIRESEIESPEKELLRSSLRLEYSPSPISPCAKSFPSPAPLIFTPPRNQKGSEIPNIDPVVKCGNCEEPMPSLFSVLKPRESRGN